jgi:hypothetical protein
LWQSGKVDLLVWAVATSRASVLSAYVEAAVAVMGADPADDAETVASRFISWLAETSRPWLVVLDDLSDTADLEGLRPDGPAGRVLITTSNPAAVPGPQRALVLSVGAFSPREALSYLMGRLTADPDQRLGAIDLVADLGYEPLALAQASAVIASSVLSCRDYRGYFARRREHMAQAGPDRTDPAGEPRMAQPCAAPRWAGPDPPDRPRPLHAVARKRCVARERCNGNADAAVAASAAVARPGCGWPRQAALAAAGCGARRAKPLSLRSRRSRALGPVRSTQPQAQAGSPMASMSWNSPLSRACNVPAVFTRVGRPHFGPAAK